jgi:hypothetical protein
MPVKNIAKFSLELVVSIFVTLAMAVAAFILLIAAAAVD